MCRWFSPVHPSSQIEIFFIGPSPEPEHLRPHSLKCASQARDEGWKGSGWVCMGPFSISGVTGCRGFHVRPLRVRSCCLRIVCLHLPRPFLCFLAECMFLRNLGQPLKRFLSLWPWFLDAISVLFLTLGVCGVVPGLGHVCTVIRASQSAWTSLNGVLSTGPGPHLCPASSFRKIN